MTHFTVDKNGHKTDGMGKLIFDERCQGCDSPKNTFTSLNEALKEFGLKLTDGELNSDKPNQKTFLDVNKMQNLIRSVWESAYEKGNEYGNTALTAAVIVAKKSERERVRKMIEDEKIIDDAQSFSTKILHGEKAEGIYEGWNGLADRLLESLT